MSFKDKILLRKAKKLLFDDNSDFWKWNYEAKSNKQELMAWRNEIKQGEHEDELFDLYNEFLSEQNN